MTRASALYIHIPFCVSICPYCDFVVYAGSAARGPANRIAAAVDALATEIRLRASAEPGGPLRSVYLGGGTPSLLAPAQVERLLVSADTAFGISGGAEITLECNPGPADRGDLAGFRAAGVKRLSIGAQSLVAGELRQLGRRHTPADIGETVTTARAAGFDNVSLDLLYDIPGQTFESWRATLCDVQALAPEHLSLYALSLDDPDAEGLTGPAGDHLPLRPGAHRWRRRAVGGQDEARAADCYALADETLAAAGYAWYEISNWARSGRQSWHNLAYWTGVAYQAVGPGAHAFDGHQTRRWNAARLDTYLAALGRGELPPGGQETLDDETAAADAAILALRTSTGLPVTDPRYASALSWARTNGLVEPTSTAGGLRLTLRGRLLSNEVFARLLPDVAQSAA